jgi:hypothetical protein
MFANATAPSNSQWFFTCHQRSPASQIQHSPIQPCLARNTNAQHDSVSRRCNYRIQRQTRTAHYQGKFNTYRLLNDVTDVTRVCPNCQHLLLIDVLQSPSRKSVTPLLPSFAWAPLFPFRSHACPKTILSSTHSFLSELVSCQYFLYVILDASHSIQMRQHI